MLRFPRSPRAAVPAVLLVAAMGWLLAGCSSDSTAPHDTVTVTPADAAGQAGYLAWSLSQLGHEFLQDPAGGVHISKREDVLVFTGAITGSCEIHFADAGGALTTWDNAAYGHMVTAPDVPLEFRPFGPEGALLLLGFEIEADVNRTAETAVVHGHGTITSGTLVTDFTLATVAVGLTGFPASGTLTVEVGPHTAVVTFDGDGVVSCTVDDQTFTVNLVDGSVTPAT